MKPTRRVAASKNALRKTPRAPQAYSSVNPGTVGEEQTGEVPGQVAGGGARDDDDEQFGHRGFYPVRARALATRSATPRGEEPDGVPHPGGQVNDAAWGPDNPRQLWVPSPGCESGQVRPTPSGKIVYGDCKGEFARMNVETGQQQEGPRSNPQQRYGKNPKEMILRLVQAVADRGRSAQPEGGLCRVAVSPQKHRWRSALDQDQPRSVTANETGRPRHVGRADHARHDGRGGVRRALYSMRASRLDPRRVLDRLERRSGVGDARRRQDLEERHTAGSRPAVVCTPSKTRPTGAVPRTSRSTVSI